MKMTLITPQLTRHTGRTRAGPTGGADQPDDVAGYGVPVAPATLLALLLTSGCIWPLPPAPGRNDAAGH